MRESAVQSPTLIQTASAGQYRMPAGRMRMEDKPATGGNNKARNARKQSGEHMAICIER